MILESSVDWVLSEFKNRVGDPYVYGGVYSPDDDDQGCDCSGLVGWVLEALVNTPQKMNWAHNVSTESWPYDYQNDCPAAPGTVGPYGTIAVDDYTDIPADAALTINIMHGGGGEDSHTNCILDGVIMESNGDAGSCTNGTGGVGCDNREWTDHWYLPGPVVSDDAEPHFYVDVSNNNWRSVDELTGFLSQLNGLGVSGVCHKVSEGNYYVDPYWQACRSWCEKNDMSWLGYHYVTTNDAASQVAAFVGNNGGGNVMLDFENNSGDIGNFWNVVEAFNAANINVSMAYIPQWYWNQIGCPDLSYLTRNGIALVSSNYPGGLGDGNTPQDLYAIGGGNGGAGWASYGGCTPSVWQFTDQANVAGFSVDCNAYHGSNLDQLFTS